MPARSDNRSDSLWPVPRQVRKVAKDRLIIGGVLITILPLAVSPVPWVHKAFDEWFELWPWVHLTLEASLNLLWVLLSLIALVRSPSATRNRRRPFAVVTLIFVLALLFPVISANDDVAQQELINDAMSAKSISATFKADKQRHSCVEVAVAPPGDSPCATFAPCAAEFTPQPASNQSVATPGETTGNHSPPTC
jgi:hypothetical protein